MSLVLYVFFGLPIGKYSISFNLEKSNFNKFLPSKIIGVFISAKDLSILKSLNSLHSVTMTSASALLRQSILFFLYLTGISFKTFLIHL